MLIVCLMRDSRWLVVPSCRPIDQLDTTAQRRLCNRHSLLFLFLLRTTNQQEHSAVFRDNFDIGYINVPQAL